MEESTRLSPCIGVGASQSSYAAENRVFESGPVLRYLPLLILCAYSCQAGGVRPTTGATHASKKDNKQELQTQPTIGKLTFFSQLLPGISILRINRSQPDHRPTLLTGICYKARSIPNYFMSWNL